MTIKEQILQEIEQLPELALEEILTAIYSVKNKYQLPNENNEVWQAYLNSKKEREEVYRRLADS